MSHWQPGRYDLSLHQRRLDRQPQPRYPAGHARPAQSRQQYPGPAVTRRQAAGRAYPSHLIRYPAGLIPRSRQRRSRGFSIGRFVYFGSHPLLVMLGVAVWFWMAALALGWVALVTLGWLLWAGAVTAWWLASMPFRKA